MKQVSTAQVVEIDGEILEKPNDADHAAGMLSRLEKVSCCNSLS